MRQNALDPRVGRAKLSPESRRILQETPRTAKVTTDRAAPGRGIGRASSSMEHVQAPFAQVRRLQIECRHPLPYSSLAVIESDVEIFESKASRHLIQVWKLSITAQKERT
jgi:hypothetical protein